MERLAMDEAEGVMRMKKTLIAIPCFDMVHADFMKAMLELEKPEGTSFAMIKNTLIYNARNTIAQNAIASGFERVLWLDSDIVFSPRMLTGLHEDLDEGRDFVSALYFMRKEPTGPVVYSDLWYKVTDDEASCGAKNYWDYPIQTVFECAGAGFGCVMTSVELLQELVGRYGAPFTPMMGISEDLAFCWRVTQCGGKMYCDSRIKCGHIGTKTFTELDYIPEPFLVPESGAGEK